MRRRMVSLAALALVLGLIAPTGPATSAAASASPAQADPGQKGPYAAGFTSFLVHDASRDDRPIGVFVWYPVDPAMITSSTPRAIYPLDIFYGEVPPASSTDFEAYGMDPAYQEPTPVRGSHPLVMFAPGSYGSGTDPVQMGARLASHGIVLAAIQHYRDGTLPSELEWDPHQVLAYHRPRDVSKALDTLLTRNATPADLLYGTMDPQMVVATGMSFGYYTSIVLAAGDDSVCDPWFYWDGYVIPWTCVPTYPDPRIKMIIPIASGNAFYWNEEARVHVPALLIDQDQGDVDYPGTAEAHAAFSGHPNYRLDVGDTIHSTFTINCEWLPIMAKYGAIFDDWWGIPDFASWYRANYCDPYRPDLEVQGIITKYMIAFIKGDQSVLTPGAADSAAGVEFFVTEPSDQHVFDPVMGGYLFRYFVHQPGTVRTRALENPLRHQLLPPRLPTRRHP